MSTTDISAAGPGVAPELPRHAPLSTNGFVIVIALLMALNALATDIMLPGLEVMADSLGVTDQNRMQTVITAYLIGFGGMQLCVGIFADRFGRKPVLLLGLAVYTLAAFFIAFSQSMEALLIGRLVQGMGAAAPRVIATATLRDCYQGRGMARIMSLAMMAFMAAPVIAPLLGQTIMFAVSWHWVFVLLGLYGLGLIAFISVRLPETMRPEDKRAIELGSILRAVSTVLTSRQALGYMLAAGTFFGALFGFINSSQQLLVGVYGMGSWFPAMFALTALSLGISSFTNSRLVERMGMRMLSHGATCAYTALGFVMLACHHAGVLTGWVFIPLMTCTMLFVGMVFSNFNALAMAPLGHVAGIGSSIIGCVTTLTGAVIGYTIGQAFDGTGGPLVTGYAVCGIVSIGILLVTERGKLFQNHGGN
ncbi:multidrug effflux MFS transporter [Paroceanicella profunda]|uniref:Bcr/CflA family efflux transporter n=1 Tax=Paroceanicella profunda TaxID=2579971 RepID=A0A5B8FW69_9RHOB|nr:multidrug effflux MFS transporter [Paroceanicella profunda]QDL90759.1 multidrug effflux MFS transporter [Paroceanicella profunda]